MATVEWIEARITATQTAIVAYEAAILALSTGAQTYSLDTGQTRQSVTRAQLGSLTKTLSMLEERLEHLEQELVAAQGTSIGVYARPAC
jgi:uncharacterized protein (DUF342 family)